MNSTHRTDISGLDFIEASAGTGKTHQLSSRVVELVALADVPVEQIAVVTFTRAAAAELRERIRSRLASCRDLVSDGATRAADSSELPLPLADRLDDATSEERGLLRSRLARAVTDVDRATVTTIHGFCQHVLSLLPATADGGAPGGVADDLGDVIRSAAIDLLVAESTAGAGGWPDDLVTSKSLATIVKGVAAVFNNPNMELHPRPGDLDADPLAHGLVALIDAVADEVESRLERTGHIGHHHLLELTDRAVRTHPEMLDELRGRFAIVLIDEFQDTDPIQWSIFRTIFLDPTATSGIVAVGDPKQAIYSFRGGDVGTYLEARKLCPEERRGQLDTNYRSSPLMVAAFNEIFEGVIFGGDGTEHGEAERETAHDVITHDRIQAVAQSADTGLRQNGTPVPPIEIRVAAEARLGRTGAQTVTSDAANRAIFADVAVHVRDTLSSGAVIFTADGPRPLEPSGIAVLCRGRSDCLRVHSQMMRVGVPAVVAGAWSVTETPAVAALRDLLWCLASPGSDGRLRRLAVGPLLRCSAEETVADASPRLAELYEAIVRATSVLAEQGVSAAYRFLRSQLELPATLMSTPGGDRLLVDLEHLVELLAAETGDRGTSPADLRSALADLEVRASGDGDQGDLFRRRTPSDGAAVQIMTVHASKGLEFDVVMCPTLHRAPNASTPFRYSRRGDDGERIKVYDVRHGSGKKAMKAPAEAIGAAKVEARDEERRIAYVAITRARHRCVLWYPGTSAAPKSALGALLRLDDAAVDPTDSAIVGAIEERWSAKAGPEGHPLFAVSTIGQASPPSERGGDAAIPARDLPDLRAAIFDRDLDRLDGRWSFSRLAHRAQPAHATRDEDPDDETLGDAGRRDEGPIVEIPLADVGMGTEFGTLVHETLERVDLSSSNLGVDLSSALVAVGGPDPDDPLHDRIVSGLTQSIRTPLGPLFDDARLADIGPADHLDEADFEFSLPSAAHAVAASRLALVLSDHLSPDDPLQPWARRLAGSTDHIELGGFMVGSIDGLFRVGAPGGPSRFVVVDYKTNFLGPRGRPLSLDDYAPDRLVDAMAHHDYPLQALIYAVATHRFLRWRIPDYDPAIHLGGAAYLFLRGMVGEGTPRAAGRPYGVFSWRLPAEMVLDASDVLSDLGSGERS